MFKISFQGWIIFHCMHIPHFVWSLTQWWKHGFLPLLAELTTLPWMRVCKYMCESILLTLFDLHLEVELLDHVATLHFSFWETAILFSIESIPFYIPASYPQEFLFFHILTNMCYFLHYLPFHHNITLLSKSLLTLKQFHLLLFLSVFV